uniref:Uncharacterized protein n=1 Tax=Candidatus Kentrum sp. TUN TaxID=2126343 RepID=A0A450ZVU0_9GAMM|nr:MAG: hypothetical protein BECKTUN1418D_GA0071000_107116 [Candidatus Kentron sp. TUN]
MRIDPVLRNADLALPNPAGAGTGELDRYKREDRSLHVCLAWSEHRRYSLAYLRKQESALSLRGDITYLDAKGKPRKDPTRGRTEDPAPETNERIRKRGLTSLRRYMAENTSGRIFIGGKRTGFTGDWPGLVEEAVFALEADQPIYLAGGFGGMTLDMIRIFDIDDCTGFVPLPDKPIPGMAWNDGLERLEQIREEKGGKLPDNGLDDRENRQLASTHRPSEIAALISLGLGRIFSGAR